MENRRATRGRKKKIEVVPESQSVSKRYIATRQRASPPRKLSPVRRSSRPRSTVFGNSGTKATTSVITPKLNDEANEDKNDASNFPTTLTTNTLSRAPHKSSMAPSAVHSSYSSTTQITTETRTSFKSSEVMDVSLKDIQRRSVSRTLTSVTDSGVNDGSVTVRDGTYTPTTVTDNESRYSRSVSRSVYDDETESKAEFSDDENRNDMVEEDDPYKNFSSTKHFRDSNINCRKLQLPLEFGGWLGALLLTTLGTLFVYYLQWTCGKSQCEFKKLNLYPLFDINYLTKVVFVNEAVNAFLLFNFLIFIMSAVLFGKRVTLHSERINDEYKFNLIFLAIFSTTLICVAEYMNYPATDFILKHYERFYVFSILFAIALAIWTFMRPNIIKDNSQNPTKFNEYGSTGNHLVNFALGTQINPKWLGIIEFKLVAYRASILASLTFAECFILKNIQLPSLPGDTHGIHNIALFYANNIKFDPVALLASALLFVYLFDTIVFEHHLASSFELQFEGCGYLLLLRYAATPFLLSSVAKYTFDRRIPFTCKYAVHVGILLLFVGLTVKRLSNAMKYKYRIDSENAIFQGIETIHTFQGRRLLLGPFWGRLRQPNYAGDILALSSLTVPLFFQFSWPPFISIILLVAILVHRATRVNARNMARYHSSWVRYCIKVPNYIIPNIF